MIDYRNTVLTDEAFFIGDRPALVAPEGGWGEADDAQMIHLGRLLRTYGGGYFSLSYEGDTAQDVARDARRKLERHLNARLGQ